MPLYTKEQRDKDLKVVEQALAAIAKGVRGKRLTLLEAMGYIAELDEQKRTIYSTVWIGPIPVYKTEHEVTAAIATGTLAGPRSLPFYQEAKEWQRAVALMKAKKFRKRKGDEPEYQEQKDSQKNLARYLPHANIEEQPRYYGVVGKPEAPKLPKSAYRGQKPKVYNEDK